MINWLITNYQCNLPCFTRKFSCFRQQRRWWWSEILFFFFLMTLHHLACSAKKSVEDENICFRVSQAVRNSHKHLIRYCLQGKWIWQQILLAMEFNTSLAFRNIKWESVSNIFWFKWFCLIPVMNPLT